MNKKALTCCFTGHRFFQPQLIPEIRRRLYEVVEELILQGVLYFGAGGALGFDTLAAQTVLELRNKYPGIKLILILPCKDQTKNWTPEEVAVYEQMIVDADKTVYTSEKYYAGCMHKRNRHLVDNSRFCVCYLTNSRGGTAYTVEYARFQGLNIWNIADPDSIGRMNHVLEDL